MTPSAPRGRNRGEMMMAAVTHVRRRRDALMAGVIVSPPVVAVTHTRLRLGRTVAVAYGGPRFGDVVVMANPR